MRPNEHAREQRPAMEAKPSKIVVDDIDEPKPQREVDPKLVGFGGWLGYFTFGLIVSIGFSLYNSYSYLTQFSNDGSYGGEILLLGVAYGALALFQAMCVYLLMKRRAVARRAILFMLFLTMAVYLADTLFAQNIYTNTGTQAPSDLYSSVERAVAFGSIWAWYFIKSKRVAATLTDVGSARPKNQSNLGKFFD